jgi:hypothetical protein
MPGKPYGCSFTVSITLPFESICLTVAPVLSYSSEVNE